MLLDRARNILTRTLALAKERGKKDFSAQPRAVVPRPRRVTTSWSIESIRAAIDAQLRGQFTQPRMLSEAMGRDDAIFNARENRLAPIQAVDTQLVPQDSTRGRLLESQASRHVHVARTVLCGIEATLVDHGVAIGYNEQEPNKSGTRVDFRLTEWPLEFVRWNPTTEELEAQTRDNVYVPIRHGDGRWTVFRKRLYMPWRYGACVLPAGLIWAAHADSLSSWQGASRAHGLAKIVGELPEGSALNDEAEAEAVADRFHAVLETLADGTRPIGIKPHGSTIDFVSNSSSAWQVFTESVTSRERAAARVYLGTDAILGSTGDAPGVDIAALFRMASTKFQSDFWAIDAGLNSGVYAPWAAINHGSTRHAPQHEFLLPDPDKDAKRAETAANRERLAAALADMREQKLQVTQEVVDTLATELGVHPTPQLAAIDQQVATVELASADVAKVVLVREARQAQGLPPFGDARDELTIAQLDTQTQAAASTT